MVVAVLRTIELPDTAANAAPISVSRPVSITPTASRFVRSFIAQLPRFWSSAGCSHLEAMSRGTAAALTAYPGGIVDRVVKLSNGEYEVHNIGVNRPHHIFVNQGFKVVGAE